MMTDENNISKDEPLSLKEKEIITGFMEWVFANENSLKNIYNKINPGEEVYYTEKIKKRPRNGGA